MDNIYRAEDWEHGLRCMDCDRLFVEGQPYSERLQAFQDDVPIVEVICLDCALTPAAPARRNIVPLYDENLNPINRDDDAS